MSKAQIVMVVGAVLVILMIGVFALLNKMARQKRAELIEHKLGLALQNCGKEPLVLVKNSYVQWPQAGSVYRKQVYQNPFIGEITHTVEVGSDFGQLCFRINETSAVINCFGDLMTSSKWDSESFKPPTDSLYPELARQLLQLVHDREAELGINSKTLQRTAKAET